jgi:hypothetical protein
MRFLVSLTGEKGKMLVGSQTHLRWDFVAA